MYDTVSVPALLLLWTCANIDFCFCDEYESHSFELKFFLNTHKNAYIWHELQESQARLGNVLVHIKQWGSQSAGIWNNQIQGELRIFKYGATMPRSNTRWNTWLCTERQQVYRKSSKKIWVLINSSAVKTFKHDCSPVLSCHNPIPLILFVWCIYHSQFS